MGLLGLVTILCCGCDPCSSSQTPAQLLQRKLASPEVELTSSERIALIEHCVRQGAMAAAEAEDKVLCLVMGPTNVGKSTFINSLLGHTMQQSRLSDLGFVGRRRVVYVDTSQPPLHPVLEVGHSSTSTTFMPQLIPDSQDDTLIYCDCPGFRDTRGEEIDIVNAIHIKQLMQRAQGLKVVFLMNYSHLIDTESTRRSIVDLRTQCLQLFGNEETLVDELTRHRDALLLGITKAPQQDPWGEEVTLELIREYLQAGEDTMDIVVEVFSQQLFLFDPLGSAPASVFHTPAQCREKLQALSVIPRSSVQYINPEMLIRLGDLAMIRSEPAYDSRQKNRRARARILKKQFKVEEKFKAKLKKIAHGLNAYSGE